jgi:hypothetical protein
MNERFNPPRRETMRVAGRQVTSGILVVSRTAPDGSIGTLG